MKRLHLFEAVGLVDDRLIEEAADAKRTAPPWGKWLAAAACVALALSLGTATAGTLLRGCGNKSAGPADTAAAPSDAPSGEMAPAAQEKYGLANGDADEPEAAAEPAAPAPDPAAGPTVVEPAESPAVTGDVLELEGAMGGLQRGIFRLDTAAEGVTITALDAGEAGAEKTEASRAQYRVENQSGADRTEILYFALDTGEEGLEGRTITIRIDGKAVPFDTYEATVCPTEDGSMPAREGRHFRIEFAALLPAQGGIEVEILDSGPEMKGTD